VVVKVSERLAVSQQAAQKFNVERFNLRKLNELDVRKEYQCEITNRFAASKSLIDRKKIGLWRALKRITKSQLKRV